VNHSLGQPTILESHSTVRDVRRWRAQWIGGGGGGGSGGGGGGDGGVAAELQKSRFLINPPSERGSRGGRWAPIKRA